MLNIWYRIRVGPLVVLMLALLLASVAGLWADRQAAEASPLLQGDSTPTPEDHTGQRCAECHLDIEATWLNGAHAHAYTVETFQADWATRNQPTSCLDCHTTLFQPSTNTYFVENVACEACHGMNPAGHPPAEAPVYTEAEMCGNCHEGTFQEHRSSPHAVTATEGGIQCDTCHDPHSQQIRFASIDELCLSCHQTAPEDFAHSSHLGRQDLHCGDCHMYRDPETGPCIASLCATGHTMTVDTLACNDCHEDLDLHLETFTAITDPEQIVLERDNLQVQVAELQAALAEREPVDDSAGRPNFIQLTQGLIMGLGVGISLAWVLLRRENGSKSGNGQK